VKKGDKITQAQAEAWLLEELSGEYLPDLRRALGDDVFYKLTDNQVSALLSFIYNLGATAFRSSTLRKKLIMGDYKGAANEFPRWNRAKGKVLKGLTNRRLDEQKLFLKP